MSTVVAEARLRPVAGLDAEPARLAQPATVALNEHVNERVWCAVCEGAAFPCDSAVLAEHNAALL